MASAQVRFLTDDDAVPAAEAGGEFVDPLGKLGVLR
jgi:hypothetical protein